MRKKLISIGFALALALTTFTSSAFAHECIIASRSDVGNLAATKSGQWVNVGSLSEVFGFVGAFAGLAPLSQSQLAWAVAEAKSQGFQNDFVFFTKFTIAGESAVDGKDVISNLKGLDHAFNLLPKLVTIYQQALTK